MFKELFEALKGKNVLVQMSEHFIEMVHLTHTMFDRVVAVVFEEAGGGMGELTDGVYKQDIQVNKLERKVRKQVLEHLSIRPGVDLPVCLVLMSVVKDAERIGDFCKNILEIPLELGRPIAESECSKELRSITEKVKSLFEPTALSFKESDKELAREVMTTEGTLTSGCDDMVARLLKTNGKDCPDAVACVLLARYLKRVAAHLGNIASSALVPLHKLDYFDERWHRAEGGKKISGRIT